jgi:hypothetical protein
VIHGTAEDGALRTTAALLKHDFDGGELKSAGRFGLRYAPSKQDKLNLRFDLDVWQNSCAYVTLGEAFERRGASRERPRVTCATSLAPPRMHERPRD